MTQIELRRDQREYVLAGICDAAQFLQAADHSRVERRVQFVLRQDDRVDHALRAGIVLLDGRHPRVRLDDFRIAEGDLFGCLRILGSFLRRAPAACECLPANVDVFLLLIGDFGALTLGLGLCQVRRRLALRDLAFLQLGALCFIVEPRQDRAGLHEITLIRLDRDNFSSDLETDFRDNLRLDRSNAKHPHFDVLFRCGDANRYLARKTPIVRTAGNDQHDNEPCSQFEQTRHQLARCAGQVETPRTL